MKYFIFAMLALVPYVHASELTLIDLKSNDLPSYNSEDSTFQVNPTTNQGFIRWTLSKETSRRWCTGSGIDRECDWRDSSVVVLEKKIDVPGLTLEGDKLVYRGPEGAIECATLGESRVFHVPTLYLSGKCQSLTKQSVIGNQKHLQLIFIAQ